MMYNSIMIDIKPLVGPAKLHYVDSFESDFSLLLRERKSVNLPTMFIDELEVEDNLMDYGKMKQRVEVDRRKVREENQPPTSSSTDAKFDVTMRTMERIKDILALDNRFQNRYHHDPQIRNTNFRILPPPNITKID